MLTILKFPTTPKQMAIWLFAIILTSAVGAGLYLPTPNPELDVQGVAQDWELPLVYTPDNPEQTHRTLNQRNAWGSKDGKITTNQAANDWRLAGIVQSGKQRFALLQDKNDNKIQRYAEGQTLDDGHKLIKIHADAIELQSSAEIKIEYLYRKSN